MSDSINGGSDEKKKVNQMTGNLFFSFAKPYLDFIGKGKIFYFVYIAMAILNLVLPFVIIYSVIDSGLFRLGAKFVFAFIFSWLVITFACWMGFQIWWNRRSKITDIAESEFVATAIFSEIFQTFGEWLGTMIAIIGAGVGLIATIFLGNSASSLFRAIGMGGFGSGAMVIIIGPLTGFFILIFSRFLAEQLRIFAALANNTKEIAVNIKNKGGVKEKGGKPEADSEVKEKGGKPEADSGVKEKGGKPEADKNICACGAQIAPGAKFCTKCGAKTE